MPAPRFIVVCLVVLTVFFIFHGTCDCMRAHSVSFTVMPRSVCMPILLTAHIAATPNVLGHLCPRVETFLNTSDMHSGCAGHLTGVLGHLCPFAETSLNM